MIKHTIINFLGYPKVILDLKKGFDKALKNIPAVWKSRWSSKQKPDITGNLYIYFFPILLQNKLKSITNSCRNNLWYIPILLLSKAEFKILRKKPSDEVFRVLFQFPRRGWDQSLADFSRFSNIETQSC